MSTNFNFSPAPEERQGEEMLLSDCIEQEINIENTTSDTRVGIFHVRTAMQCLEDARALPDPLKLFGSLWIEGELCILFSDTNVGKSILAVQIANSISRGENAITELENETEAQKVIYCDFEMSDKQFELRYSDASVGLYPFNENFVRIKRNQDASMEGNYEDLIYQSLEACICKTGAKVVIIDNITFLKMENEQAKDAMQLMNKLRELKNNYALSMLVLAHTPKREHFKPISINDIQGSKMFSNFADSAFSIGRCRQDENSRYLIQLKVRSSEMEFGAENVMVCQLKKIDYWLCFIFMKSDTEKNLIQTMDEAAKMKLRQQILEMAGTCPNREIARKVGCSESLVRKVLKKAGKMA